jgi:hypothetical protein
MQIALTALVTILVGALTLVVGQIIIRGAIEPALELKRLIGTIAHDLDFYANRFRSDDQGWSDIFRKHSCSLREKLNVITFYAVFERVFQLPPEKNVRGAATVLVEYSNRSTKPEPPFEHLETKIKQLLRINT